MAQESKWVKTGVTGRLIYVPDAQGDRIPDFSMAGYGEGKRAIPADIPVVIHIDPIPGDNTQHIQNAINFAASRPLQANGFRGVVELGPGKFDVSARLNITTSGVVLRGAGGGDSLATNTHIVSQNRTDSIDSASTPVIDISGSTSGSTQGPVINIIDKVVPVGAQSFRVASTAGLAAGTKIDVFRPSSAAWIAELGMDQMPEGAWTTRNLHFFRTVTRVEGNRVFVDAPIPTAIDQQWSTGNIRTFTMPGVIRNVGVENLRGQSLDAREESNELRTPTFVRFTRVDDGFVRDIETRHFAYASVFTSESKGTQHITVDNVTSRQPSGVVTGGRRYTFALDAPMSLVQNSFAEAGRHDFVTGSEVSGPIVFRTSSTTGTRADSGPHHRWASGLLFDSLDINGNAINVQNRWTSGSGHGWAGANVVIWNSEANSFIAQSPPTAQTWLVGSTGTINAGNDHLPNYDSTGYYDRHGTRVTTGGEQSLYEAQSNDASDLREFHWNGGSGAWTDALEWDAAATPGVYSVSLRDYLWGDIDNYTLDGSSSVDDQPVDAAFQAAIQAASPHPVAAFDRATASQNAAFTMTNQLSPGERVIHGSLAMSLKQTGGQVTNDFVQLFDTAAAHRLNFSSLGWATQVNSATPFVGVIDMGPYLDRLQAGSVNAWVSDNTGVDWAMYTVAVATPKADAVGAMVFLDGGQVRVDDRVAPIGGLQNGGPAASILILGPAGHVAVNSDFLQAASSVLAIEVAGPNQAGKLAVGDQALLDGRLEMHLVGGFMPAIGHSVNFLSAAHGLVGTRFDAPVIADSVGSALWGLTYDSLGVTAHVVSNSMFGDLNRDGLFDSSDWAVYISHAQTNLAGLAPAETYARGDLNLDGVNNLTDMDLFMDAFDAAHGAGAFAAMLAGVPEPHAALLALCGAAFLAVCGRRL
jgi:hypothetical protein